MSQLIIKVSPNSNLHSVSPFQSTKALIPQTIHRATLHIVTSLHMKPVNQLKQCRHIGKHGKSGLANGNKQSVYILMLFKCEDGSRNSRRGDPQ